MRQEAEALGDGEHELGQQLQTVLLARVQLVYDELEEQIASAASAAGATSWPPRSVGDAIAWAKAVQGAECKVAFTLYVC